MNFELVFKNLITSIINGNQAFYNIDDEIEWKFLENDNVDLISYCNNDYVILVNPLAIKHNLDNNTMDKIEYSLLASVRHLFQRLEIEGMEFDLETINDKEVIKVWKDELETLPNLITNANFFDYKSNLDAYAFAYAVMKYKYSNVDCLDKPSKHTDEFEQLVNSFLEEFKEEIHEVDNY